jgi:hypothetical protein
MPHDSPRAPGVGSPIITSQMEWWKRNTAHSFRPRYDQRVNRRVSRHLLTIVTVLSLLLCVATCLMWVRGYWWTDRAFWKRADHLYWIQSWRGEVSVQVEASRLSAISGFGLEREREDTYDGNASSRLWDIRWVSFPAPPNKIILRSWAGFWYCTLEAPTGILVAEVAAPSWSIALATAALPLGWTIAQIRSSARSRRRQRLGLCATCGYDLHASVDRCPECGTTSGPSGQRS